MATLLTPSGESRQVTPANGKAFTLDELYALIGCEMVQMIHLPDGRDMWMDEEGKFNDKLLPNELASKLLLLAGGIDGDYVLGNALLATPEEGGEEDGDE